MSELRSALDEWAGQDLDEVDIDQLADDLAELEVSVGRLEAERARRLTAYRRRGGPKVHGYPSLTAFLMHRCRMASGRARRLVGLADTATRCPVVHRAWAEQEISTDQAHRLLEASDAVPQAFVDAEPGLVEAVRPLTAGDTRRALSYWRQAVTDGAALEDDCEDMRGVSMSRTIGGWGRIDGWLTPEVLETLQTALAALTPPPAPGDPRNARQRRHDALADLARDYLERADTPVVGGERPHINVVCDLPALMGIAGGLHETENGEVLDIATLRTLACDSSICRIVLGPRSEVIDVGRRTRTIPAALRRAVIARDRHCTHRGCERPARWCDVHHVRHWANLGVTEGENLRLLCRYHHTLVHREEARAGVPHGPSP
jgi:hypothetical protein